ncbi:MAG: DUF4184 family protein [Bacteroidota bacterium]
MPFTFAHPAIVLPFGRLSKRWVSLTGLVAGSMTPDFEYFIRMRVSSIYSHTWPGLFWFDLPLGFMLVLLYQSLVKDKLIIYLPNWLNRRFSSFNDHPNYSFIYFLIIVVSVWLGALSHLLWDAFTHPEGYFIRVIPALSRTIILLHRPVYIYKILQHGSTIIGFAIILLTIFKLPNGNISKAEHIGNYWLKIVAVMVVVLVLRLLSGLSLHAYGDWIVTAISGSLLGLLIVSVFAPSYQALHPHQQMP